MFIIILVAGIQEQCGSPVFEYLQFNELQFCMTYSKHAVDGSIRKMQYIHSIKYFELVTSHLLVT